MLAGNIEAAAKIISDALGIHKTLVLLLLAGIKQDKEMFVESVADLGKFLEINP